MTEAAHPHKLDLARSSARSAFTGMQHTPPKTDSPPPEQASSHQNKVLETVFKKKEEPAHQIGMSHSESTLNSTQPTKKRKSIFSKWWFRLIMIILLVVLVIGAPAFAVGSYTMGIFVQLKLQSNEAQALAQTAYQKFKSQDLPGAQQKLESVKTKLQEMRGTYKHLDFYNSIPFARGYYQDGIHGFNAADAGVEAGLKTLKSVNQYADVLGFKGQGTFTGGSAEERLKLMLQTLSKITPELDAIGSDLNTVQAEINQIDPNRYPKEFQGKEVRAKIVAAQQLSAGAAQALTEFRPVIEQIPYVAGADGKRKKYFVLFQNDNELRPTGGFLTAYSVVFVENGKVTPEKSDDIYELDKKYAKKLPIPPILGKYLTTETKWNLRDMNIDPDFKKSMDQFLKNYKVVPGEPRDIDGIAALDTQVLVDLLNVLGPIDVPGYGKFSAENDPQCDCPQIIHALSEIITRPTPYIRQDRKGILGPMMGALLQKAYSAPKTQWPKLFEIAWKDVQGRHAQFYFFDEKSQAAAEKINAAGRMTIDPNAGDFMAVVDANLGGAKSNLFITYGVNQQISSPQNGKLDKKVEITYKNSHHADNCNLEAGLLCLNARLRDWFRLYVPKGTQLKSSLGFREGSVKTSEEGDFTVIEGEFFLDPLSQTKLQLEYTVPYTDTNEYKVKLWKQGGISSVPVTFDTNGNQQTVTMDKDLVFTTKF